ncbi:MAG: creatininase family protein, partial [Candidatus Aminicenantes bacterium]|nr:creatininase family protein [Candidatus Aminicenantes bacterium]
LPCGRCEKCRRIVGMLIALGEDPKRCGYTPDQIEFCLKELSQKSVHQEAPGAEHLLHLLKSGGHLPPPVPLQGKKRPEIMRLRFEEERSPLNTLPPDIRRRLWSVFAEYADGAVRKVGRRWEDFSPSSGSGLDDPYPFSARLDGLGKEVKSGVKDIYLLGELTWPEAKMRFREVDVALLPVGAIEQHGPHLPLDTDAFDADYLAKRVAENCSFPKPLVFPLVPYGVSYHHEDFSGTMSVSPRTLSLIIYDIGICAARNGIKKLVIINGHGGNIPSLQFAAQMINRDAFIFTCVETGETSDKDIQELSETPNDVHAGEIETSTTMAVRPDAVRHDRIKKFIPRFSSRYLDFSSKRSVEWYARTSKISASGVLGDPTKATREKGEIMWDHMIRHLVEFVEDLKSLSLEEIFQKKY